MARSLLTEGRILRRAKDRREPQPAPLVEHGVVHVGLAIPDRFVSPVWGWLQWLPRSRRLGIADRHLDLACGMPNRVEHGNEVGAELGCTVNQSIGVHRWIALVARDFVVEILLGRGPVPLVDHYVPLDALRPGRGRRQFAGRYAVGP